MRLLRFPVLFLALSLSLPALAADYVYATKDLSARRWQDNEVYTSGEIKTNDRLEVVYKTEGWVRVRIPRSPKFGWLPADAVTETAPAGVESAAPGGLEDMSPELQQMIQQKMKELELQQPGGAGQ